MAEAPKHGRRAAPGEGDDAPRPVVKGWGEDTQLAREDTFVPTATGGDPVDLPTLDAGVDDAPVRPREDEDMSREVAAAPVEYHSSMPKLSELDLGLKWSKIQQKCSEEFDMTCLTDVLCQHLDDEDVAWQPDILLVQLTSELLDAVERKDEADAAAGGSVAPISMVGGISAAGEPLARRRSNVGGK